MTPSALVEPAFASIPPYVQTLGPEVADLADLAGFAPDPEQRLALDAIFALDDAGLSAAFEIALICCRQNMKTGTCKQAALGWLYLTDQRLIVWSAHEFRTAQEAFRDMDQLITGSDYLRRRVKNIYRGNGDESIELMSGQRLIFKTRTKGGGRGLTGDKVILDEAFALQPMHMGALLPTLSARPDPQVLYGSSAGLDTSGVLRAVRDRGRPGGDPSLAYFEWCAPEDACANGDNCDHSLASKGCALDNREFWRRANPAIGRRISEETIAKERRALPVSEFARERLGWWDDPADEGSDIDLSGWPDLEDEEAEAVSLAAFAVEISLDRVWTSIAAAGPAPDGRTHLELVEHARGTGWVVARCKKLNEDHGPAVFVVDSGGPAASLIPDLEAAGLTVLPLSTEDVVNATATFIDNVADRAKYVHGPQLEIEAAIESARKRSVGDGKFAIGRKASGGDVTPLQAVIFAAYGAAESPYARVLFLDEEPKPDDGVKRAPDGTRIITQEETTTLRYDPTKQ